MSELAKADIVISSIRNLLNDGEVFEAHGEAKKALDDWPDLSSLRVLYALACARAGAIEDAAEEITHLQDAGLADLGDSLDIDEIDMITEVFLEGWRQSSDTAWLRKALSFADLLGETCDSPWLKARGAIISRLLGQSGEAQARVASLGESVEDASDEVTLHTAKTVLFAALINEQPDTATDNAKRVLALTDGAFSETVPLSRLMRELGDAGLELPQAVLDTFAPPRVVVFTGQDLDHPSSTVMRFPVSAEADVRLAIEEAISSLDPQIGYTTLAAGSSIMFAEAMLERGRELHVVLPFSIADVLAQDVEHAGDAWVDRFQRCLDQATSVNFATTGDYLGHDALYSFGNQMLHGMATLRSRFLDTQPYLLALWDYEMDSLQGGAADFIDQWGDIARLRLLDLSAIVEPDPDAFEDTEDDISADSGESDRQVKVMLFADIVHYSKLNDEHLPLFLDAMKKVADDLHHDFTIDFMASWGDALFIVMDQAVELCAIGLALTNLVPRYASSANGLPVDLQVRVSLDAGPVYGGIDPFTNRANYWGFHINRAARLEPVTIPGQVYASLPFVALLTSEESVLRSEYLQEGKSYQEQFGFAYIGRLSLAKNFGEQPVYHLRARHAASLSS